MLDLRGVSVMAMLGGILLLTGCEEPAASHADSGAPSWPPSATSSAPADLPSAVPADTTPKLPRAAASPTGAAASPRPTGTVTSAPHSGCQNLTATSAVKAAVTAEYQRSFPRFAHIRPVPQQFFYGQCGGVRYAATRFESTSGATHEQLVGMQDEGSATKYFRGTAAGMWSYLATDSFPRAPHGCGDVPQIPEPLAAAWGNCPVG
ncbi:hypothetical protein DI272_09725 [Streptomyces sp. Act143]|uniref:hypothetical protein n=1 Tax=Streptomyces sp. Act143 TaxID=2200760 RepID=UPI000D67DB24|nr:hypothetical protein [Streptomyces sp. Act143]PWI14408.1 hypothetical protein DI272_09725 [Streptomyces sp. Act143]